MKFALLVGFACSSIAPVHALQAMEQKQVSPRLLSIIKKKYIDGKPLKKNEKQYLKKAATIAIAAGIGLLLAGGAVGMRKKAQAARQPKQVASNFASLNLKETVKDFSLDHLRAAKRSGKSDWKKEQIKKEYNYYHRGIRSSDRYVDPNWQTPTDYTLLWSLKINDQNKFNFIAQNRDQKVLERLQKALNDRVESSGFEKRVNTEIQNPRVHIEELD